MRYGPSYAFAQRYKQPANFGELESDAATTRLIAGNTAFALDLYRLLRKEAAGNILVSPYSISQSLAMLYLGAAGQTAEQMSAAMHFPHDRGDLQSALQKLNASLAARGDVNPQLVRVSPPRALQSVNGLWGDQSVRFDPAFSAQLEHVFGTGPQAADFRNEPLAACERINAWVARNTHTLIQGIVPPDAITPDVQLVLVNALYFYGAWEYLFEERDTKSGDFFRLDGTRALASFMQLHKSLPYAEGNGYRFIEFPYFGSRLALTVILPDQGQFTRIEEALDSDLLEAAVGQLTDRLMTVFLPKFEFEFATSLVGPLDSLGMSNAFDPHLANFAGIADASSTERLFLNQVLHKAVINVDEDGTEASGATLSIVSLGGSSEVPLEIRVDRPFLFLIRDTHTGTVLFIGRVMDPGAS